VGVLEEEAGKLADILMLEEAEAEVLLFVQFLMLTL
jgi:hypothetical protein|tara:strand:- start:420 stop:527 length:108 start_codon:yes stop_codon:yes gene_type:complete